MNKPTDPADDTSTTFLEELPILEEIRIRVFSPPRLIEPGTPVADSRYEIAIVAVRHPSYATNDEAAYATSQLLDRERLVPKDSCAAYTLFDLFEERANGSNVIARMLTAATRLAREAHRRHPDSASESILQTHMPFTVEFHPRQDHTVYLDEQQRLPLSSTIALLMLAWYIDVKH